MNPPDNYLDMLEQLRRELEPLPDKPDETAETTLNCLWALAEGRELAVGEAGDFAPSELDADATGRLEQLVAQRLDGVPLAYLTGRQDFMGQVLLASPAALVPRRETEQLGYTAVRRLQAVTGQPALLLDVCTGAGNVALGVACHVPHARVMGADLSPDAVALAGRNAAFLQRPDVEFRCGDLLAPFDEPGLLGAVDVITCNPPYISTARTEEMPDEIRQHEPRLAFDGGPFGVKIIRRLIAEAPRWLRPGGWLILEVGAGQGDSVARMLERDPHYDEVHRHANADGEIRVVEARRAPAGPA